MRNLLSFIGEALALLTVWAALAGWILWVL